MYCSGLSTLLGSGRPQISRTLYPFGHVSNHHFHNSCAYKYKSERKDLDQNTKIFFKDQKHFKLFINSNNFRRRLCLRVPAMKRSRRPVERLRSPRSPWKLESGSSFFCKKKIWLKTKRASMNINGCSQCTVHDPQTIGLPALLKAGRWLSF